MSKLQYKTKQPKKGYTDYQSFSTHELTDMWDKLPPDSTQRQALNIVNESMQKLLRDLDGLGYDMTKARFSIHFKK